MNVMIIDDEADIGLILGMELKFLGHQAQHFSHVKDAQDFFLKNPQQDVIICDFQMPLMSGLELFKWFKKNAYQGQFFILTGEPTMDEQSLLDHGITRVLFKPQDLNKMHEYLK